MDINFKNLSKILKNYDPSLSLLDFEIKQGSQKVHFCSSLYSLVVKIKNRNGECSKMSIIIKTVPKNPTRIQFIQVCKFFTKEIAMYREVVPDIMKPCGLDEAFSGIIDTFSSSCLDKCYIVMQDLSEQGYITYANRIIGLDEEHCKLVVKKLAHIHAASFVKHKGKGEILQEAYPEIQERFWKTETNEASEEMNRLCMTNTLGQIKKLLTKFNLQHGIPLVANLMENGHETLSKLAKVPDKKYPAVVGLGDCWTNNFLFKYDNEDLLVDMKFVDFQHCRIASRMTDLSYLLYTSTSNHVLNENLESMLQIYFDAFCQFTFLGGILPETMNWESFTEEWEFYKEFGILNALLMIPFMYVDADNLPNMEDMKESDMKAVDGEVTDTFSEVWEYKPMQDKLFNLIFNHLK